MRDEYCRLPLALLLGSASLLLVAGCGSGEAKPSAVDSSTRAQPTSASTGTATPGAAGAEYAPRDHPCDFVTQAEASTILNKSVTAGYDGSSACIYTAPGAEGKQTILRFMAGERSDFDYNKENGFGTPFDVPGIGDAAVCETDKQPEAELLQQ